MRADQTRLERGPAYRSTSVAKPVGASQRGRMKSSLDNPAIVTNLGIMKRRGWVVIRKGTGLSYYVTKTKELTRVLGQAEIFPTKKKAQEEADRWPNAKVERRYEDTWRTL